MVSNLKEDVFIFGASRAGIECFNNTKNIHNIVGYIDNDKNKWNTTIENINVYSPDILLKYRNNRVIIASVYYKEIINQLEKMEIYNYDFEPIILKNHKMDNKIVESKRILFKKLRNIDIKSLKISDYNKRYLSEIINDAKFFLQVYSEILQSIITKINKPLDEVNFIDYGGGTGILSILAKEVGFGNVYYNDIYDVSCCDAKEIASKLGYNIKDYICGDLKQVIKYCNENKICFDCLGNFDVLEHIYNLKKFFSNIRYISENSMVLSMFTTANPYNKEIVEKLTQQHKKIEYEERVKVYGCKERDSLKAYFHIRIEIIKQYLESKSIYLDDNKIKELSNVTKGKDKNDIIRILDGFLKTNNLPDNNDKFSSNTCDPYTGNWAEHLIDFEELISYIQKLGKINISLLPNNKEELKNSNVIAINLVM
ncbi:methyltransferase domain-containing protein [Clostridium botulinum]|uniref:methyltransferase domain-containing protein n=1 Tax=Clostridium botulinum TaxID=1491 RepID=UPI000957ADEE|nr:methyltransferase domain-containing protein [Clostridium botulinum]APU61651.1 methyltransferase domain protein [Clostridium botulinum]